MLRKLFPIFFSVLFYINSSHATPTIEQYGQLETTSLMTLSPDGEKIAFRKVEPGTDSIVVYSLKKAKVLQAIDVSSITPQRLYFVNNKYLVIRVSDNLKTHILGDSRDISVAYALEISSGKLEQLLKPGDNIYTHQSDIGYINGASKNGKYVYMPAYYNPSRDVITGTSITIDKPLKYALMKVELSSPNNPKKVSKGHRDAIDFLIGPKDKIFARQLYKQTTNQHRIMVKNKSKWKTIYDKKVPIREIKVLGVTPDYKHLVTTAYMGDRLHYYKMSINDGTLTDPKINREDADIEEVLMDINRVAFGVRYSGLLPSYKLFNAKEDQFLNAILASARL